MKFTITEADTCRLTGYSRQQLQNKRLGSRQTHNGKVYITPPVLDKGKDWQRYGRAVLYAAHITETIKKKEPG